jgi:hypothetical protein
MKYNEDYYRNKVIECHSTESGKLGYNLSKWVDKICINVHVAANEQKAWTFDMLGYPTVKMPTKAMSGYLQTGDYHIYLPDYDIYGGICGERKSIPDAYSTFLTGTDRFNREITRFQEDVRFEQFIIFVEGSQEEYLVYQPAFRGKQYNKQVWAQQAAGTQHKAAHKRGTLNGFHARGAHVVFSGSRERAAADFIDISKKWIKYNYIKILDL